MWPGCSNSQAKPTLATGPASRSQERGGGSGCVLLGTGTEKVGASLMGLLTPSPTSPHQTFSFLLPFHALMEDLSARRLLKATETPAAGGAGGLVGEKANQASNSRTIVSSCDKDFPYFITDSQLLGKYVVSSTHIYGTGTHNILCASTEAAHADSVVEPRKS